MLHIAVYRVAHKDLRVWIAVSNFLNKRKDRHAVGASPQMDEPGAKSEEGAGPRYILRTVADRSERHPMMKRLRKYIELVSLIAPLLLSIIFQFIVFHKGYLDWILILIVYALLTFAITSALTLFENEVAVVPWPTKPLLLQGWCVTESTGRMHPVAAPNFDATWKVVPGVSLVLCSAIILANQAPHSAAYAALTVVMTILGPICFVRLTRGDDMKMKSRLIVAGCAFGALVLLVFLLLLPATRPSRDPQEPEKEPDAFDRILAVMLSRLGQDLARVVQYAQIGFIFSQTVSLLRFDYGQNRDQSLFEWEESPSAELDKLNVPVYDGIQDPSMIAHLTSRVANSQHVFIPAQLQPFSAPTFKGSIIGSYFCFIIAVLLFPMPEQCVLWTPATFIGQSLGGALSVTWNGQWKALWSWQLSDTLEDC